MGDVVRIGDATLYHGDCLEILPTLPKVDAVIADPPYGINWVPRVNNTERIWLDDKQFDPSPFIEPGRKHLFWGANYFCHLLPPSESWYLWLKRADGWDDNVNTYAPVEMAWSDFGHKQRVKRHCWNGAYRAGDSENRDFLHPAQKPLEIMEWCVRGADSRTVADPFMGSGTTGVACANLGRKFIGIEIERKYFDIACERIDNAYRQQRMFA